MFALSVVLCVIVTWHILEGDMTTAWACAWVIFVASFSCGGSLMDHDPRYSFIGK